MFKTLTFRTVLMLFVLAFTAQTSFAQAFWTETFSDKATATANWISGGTNSNPTPKTWVWNDTLAAGSWNPDPFTAPTGATGYMWFNSDANLQNDHDVTLTGVGAPASCTGKKDVHFRFYTYYRTFSGADVARVGISTDGVNFTYRNVPEFDALEAETTTSGPQFYHGWIDIDVNEADNAAQVWVQFRWEGNFEYYWRVDDLEMYEYVTPKHNITFKVNMSQVTIDPAGAKIAGTFTSWADADMTDEGNGVWSYTTALDEGAEVLWKYKNGENGWENVTAACGKDDGFGGFNRVYTVPASDATLTVVCLNSCDPCVVSCAQNPNSIICDNFDTYNTAMKLGPQATHWNTWSGTEGTTEDGIVTTEQANTAPNSFKMFSTAASGGPQDVVLNLGNKTSGHYSLKWNQYVPAGKNGYFNIQNVVPIGAGDWNFDVFFNDNGAGAMQIGADPVSGSFTYPYDTWFPVAFDFDLDNNLMTFWVDGKVAKKIAYAKNLGGIDFYCTNNKGHYYVDDVEYVSLPAVVYNVDLCDAAVDLSLYFGGSPGVPVVTPLQDNTNATASASDPAVDGTCWSETSVDKSMWYTFVGDGERYHIETVPCNATNYIGGQDDPGDTQMAIYSGDCGDPELVACNDDLFTTGTPDWRAGLDIETEAGTSYLMLIDGFNFQNVVAEGEFCIEITLAPSVDCSAGAVGQVDLGNGFLCFEENLNTLMVPDVAGFIIPTVGPVFGVCWCITTAPVPQDAWPGSIPGIASTPFSPAVNLVNLPNDGVNFPAGQYFLTPVVVGGGTLINSANPARIFNVDPTNGCYFVGESKQMVLLTDPASLEPVAANVVQVPAGANVTLNLTPGGGYGEEFGDESFYVYQWSNGATTQDITVPAGSGPYSVTVSDITGCDGLDAFVTSVATAVQDPESVKSLVLSPNPTRDQILVSLSLDKAADVRAEVVNAIGQKLTNVDFGKQTNLNQRIALNNFADGTYFLRISIDGQMTYRSFVVSH